MTSVLTENDILNIGHAQPQDRPLNLFAYAFAVEAAVIRKLVAGVSVEPVAFAKWIDHPTDAGGDVCYFHPNAAQPEGCIPLVTLAQLTTAIAAARVQALEEAAKVCEAHTGRDVSPAWNTSAMHCAGAIRALLGKEQS